MAAAPWWLAGCVTVELPTFAHVHVGHAITGWTDTPGGRGLCEVALADAAVAAEHARFAVEGARDIESVRLHLGHVLHAVDPARAPSGPGSGYGLVQALDGCVDHLGYAAEVRDASANLKAGLPPLVAALQPSVRESRSVAALAAEAQRSGDAAVVVAYAQEVAARSGAISARLSEVRQRLAGLLAAESPPYRPVARRYLFGIVRLPSGDWGWAPSAAASGSAYRAHH